MNNEKYKQIIDEAYRNYCKGYWELSYLQDKIFNGSSYYEHDSEEYNFEEYSKEDFINKIKTDTEFSEKWGVQIEERELSTVRERKKYDNYYDDLIGEYLEHHETLDKRGVPRKITTITYNNETTESYE